MWLDACHVWCLRHVRTPNATWLSYDWNIAKYSVKKPPVIHSEYCAGGTNDTHVEVAVAR